MVLGLFCWWGRLKTKQNNNKKIATCVFRLDYLLLFYFCIAQMDTQIFVWCCMKEKRKKWILKKKSFFLFSHFFNLLWILFAWQLPWKHTNRAFGAAWSSLGSEEHAALQPAHNSTSIMSSTAWGFVLPSLYFTWMDFCVVSGWGLLHQQTYLKSPRPWWPNVILPS